MPKDVRERLGLKSGDRLVFEFEEGSVRLRVEHRRSLADLKGSLASDRGYPGREAEREAACRYLGRREAGLDAEDQLS